MNNPTPTTPQPRTDEHIKSYKHFTMKLLNHNSKKEFLSTHTKENKIRFGLKINVPCHIQLTQERKMEWDYTLLTTSKKLMNILINHHMEEITRNHTHRVELKQK